MFGATAMTQRPAETTEGAFLAQLEPLLPMAYRLAYGMLRRAEEAEDAVQDAAFAAWRSRATFRGGSEMRPWFLAIVANRCRKLVRTRWWSVLRVEEPEAVSAPPGAAASDEALQLRVALGRLGPRDRLVLVLRYYLDLPFAEVAATLRISPGAARVRTHRALRRLKLIVPEELEDG